VLFSFSIWKVRANKIILKKSSKEQFARSTNKKVEHFQASPKEKKVTLDTSPTADVCIGLHFCLWKWEYIFSGNENVKTRRTNSFWERECKNENKNFFPRKTARMEKSHPYRTLMVRYVKVVRKGNQVLWQLLVNLIQIFHAALRYFYIKTPLRVTANLKPNI
jgi:hypothetical protein